MYERGEKKKRRTPLFGMKKGGLVTIRMGGISNCGLLKNYRDFLEEEVWREKTIGESVDPKEEDCPGGFLVMVRVPLLMV